MSANKTGAYIRGEAAKAVDAVVNQGRSLDDALARAEQSVRPEDFSQLRNICYGTCRWYLQLDAWLGELLSRPLRKRDSVIHALLCTGLFQLAHTRTPDHAAVSMTVEAARMLRQPKFASLINAVLRNFRRRNIADKEFASDSVRFAHPEWLAKMLQQDWPDDWQSILEANNERAPMWLRVNQLQSSTADYLKQLNQLCDEPAEMLDAVPSAIRLADPMPVDTLPGFENGAVSVQDAAAQMAAPWLDVAGARSILDACAAPGGKTGHLLELADPDAAVTAIDVSDERLQRVGENLARLKLDATLLAADASNSGEWWDGQPFDRILLDAPCSASGVIRRHPDIKLLRRESDIEALASLQAALLKALWETLAPGGRLLYVTCSVLAAENDRQIAGFLQQNGDATELKVLPNNNIRALMHEKAIGYQVLPGTRGLDGFYFACLEKDAT